MVDVFEPVNLDDCPGNSFDFYRQRDFMREIGKDLARQGKGELARIFTMYALYSHQLGHAWRWHELGREDHRMVWASVADRTYEKMPEVAKWA